MQAIFSPLALHLVERAQRHRRPRGIALFEMCIQRCAPREGSDSTVAQRVVIHAALLHAADRGHQLVVVGLVLHRIDVGRVDDEQRRPVVRMEEARVGVVEAREIGGVDARSRRRCRAWRCVPARSPPAPAGTARDRGAAGRRRDARPPGRTATSPRHRASGRRTAGPSRIDSRRHGAARTDPAASASRAAARAGTGRTAAPAMRPTWGSCRSARGRDFARPAPAPAARPACRRAVSPGWSCPRRWGLRPRCSAARADCPGWRRLAQRPPSAAPR